MSLIREHTPYTSLPNTNFVPDVVDNPAGFGSGIRAGVTKGEVYSWVRVFRGAPEGSMMAGDDISS